MSAQSQPVVIVGAGVSGLCCALHLQERGLRVLLLEADDQVGGRVRTDRIDGFLLDRGFQVLLTAYPEAQDMLDLDALRLGSFAPGAMVRTGSRFARVVDPFRRPGDALRTLFSGVATPLDALRIVRLRRRVGRGAPQDLLGGASHATLDALQAERFSERIIEGFFRPFLGGVLLDRELRGSSRALDFLFRMFAEGDAALPAQGMGAIPSQLAARLAPGTLRTRTRVARLDGSRITLESDERIDARALVVATAARAAAKLIPGLPVPEANPACCLQFDAPSAPAVGDFLPKRWDDGIGDTQSRGSTAVGRAERAAQGSRLSQEAAMKFELRELPYAIGDPDHQNARQRYVEALLSRLANCRFANENLETCILRGGS